MYAVLLALRVQEQFQRYRVNRDRVDLIPVDGSLVAIAMSGNRVMPRFNRGGDLEGQGYVLLLVIHYRDLRQEIERWNRVVKLTGEPRCSLRPPIEFWGICDDGRRCESSEVAAEFPILGYLDPYEMRAVANADARQEALLYDRSAMLKARVPTSTEPQVQSDLILQRMRLNDGHNATTDR